MNNEQEFTQIQNALRTQLVLHDQFDKTNIRTIAGVDLAYWKQEDREYAVCCIVVIDFSTHEIIETKQTLIPFAPGIHYCKIS
jgi:deoxyribonuclease V